MNKLVTTLFPIKSPLLACPVNPTSTVTPRQLHQQNFSSSSQGLVAGR